MRLQRRPNQQAAELADALGVSVRTLHRYMTMLDEMGIPICSERGPYGGFSLVRGDKMAPLVFTPEEAVSQEYVDLLPQAQLAVIPGADHFLFVSQPAAFAEAVQTFLAQ